MSPRMYYLLKIVLSLLQFLFSRTYLRTSSMMIFRLLILSIENGEISVRSSCDVSIGVSKSKLQSGRYFPFDCLAVTLLQSPLRPKEMENRTWHSDSETQP
jgi:hypothetical protein